MRKGYRSFYVRYPKPAGDFFVALMGLLVASPIFLVVALLLAVANRGSVFFYQQRPGKNEKPFRIIKFKTMNDRRDAQGNLLPDGERLTPVGRFVRKTSLDEIPQLLNVLKGDISLIGPRPLLMEYLPRYNKRQRMRHWVKPGITGWAQVNGRNAISWEEKFAYDVEYVEKVSFGLDMRILFKTVINVLASKDINSNTSATMEAFQGTKTPKS